MISKLWGKIHIDNNLKIVVIRLNRHNQLCNSKPCNSCATIFNALDISDVWWSTVNGKITNGEDSIDFSENFLASVT